MYHYIYLVQEIQFVNTNIYKIGKTTQKPYQRFNNYAKGTVVEYVRKCKNCHVVEAYLIRCFKRKFKQRRDVAGTESFEGDVDEMIETINTVLSSYKKQPATNQISVDHKNKLETVHVELKTLFVGDYRIHKFRQFLFTK